MKSDFITESIMTIYNDAVIQRSLAKSPSTTKNVNDRLKRVHEMIVGNQDE